MTRFGRLETVNLYDAWAHEAHEFTPWLAEKENLDRLSRKIGIRLELVGTEVRVGKFRADIVATAPNGSRVVIENQLDRSDNKHLGQVMTYMTGVDKAETVVWIARDFYPSHLKAVRWLNKHTADPFAFLAVTVRVVRIANSPMVPIFKIEEGPDKWEVREAAKPDTSKLGKLGKWRRDFWTHYADRHPGDGVRAGHAAAAFWVPIPSVEVNLSPYLAKGHVGVWIRGQRKESADQVRDRIQPWSARLGNELDVDLNWEAHWGAVGQTTHDVNTENPENWPEAAEWLHNRIADLRRILNGPPDGDEECHEPTNEAREA